MSEISRHFAAHHKLCDRLFAAAEEMVAGRHWDRAQGGFESLRQAMEHHFSIEEERLFPAFEERTGQTMGPTQVMRMEHAQMRQLLTQMQGAVGKEDDQGYLGLSETLMMIMQQHNIKEEQILYRMSDQALGDLAAPIIAALEKEND